MHFRSEQVRTTHPRPGQRHLLTAPAPSRAIRGVLGKFADLPQEAEDEIRGLDERRAARIRAELDRRKSNAYQGAKTQDRRSTTVAADRATKGCRLNGNESGMAAEIGAGQGTLQADDRGGGLRRAGLRET